MLDYTEDRSPLVVLVTSAYTGDPMCDVVKILTGDGPSRLPTEALRHIDLADPDSIATAAKAISHVRRAAYVIVQEPLGQLDPVQTAVAVAAAARAVPLLVLCPKGNDDAQLAKMADLKASGILNHPKDLEADGEWERFWLQLKDKAKEIRAAYANEVQNIMLEPVVNRLARFGGMLRTGGPSKKVAKIIVDILDSQTNDVTLEDHAGYLEFTFPFRHYVDFLRKLTDAFGNVQAIADPFNERLKWEDPQESGGLGRVQERIFFIDDDYARDYGIEGRLYPLARALEYSVGEVSAVRLNAEMREQLGHLSAGNSMLTGLNRFYADDNIVGGYADATSERIRVLIYRDRQSPGYQSQAELLKRIDALRISVPREHKSDLTALASWVYSNVLDPPRIAAIYRNEGDGEADYANNYDGNIVRVTPTYYPQLDFLAARVKDGMYDQYDPFSEEGTTLRVLELGVGTGALTRRILLRATDFCNDVEDSHASGPPIVSLSGWDKNRTMVAIAKQRLDRAFTSRAFSPRIQWDLQHFTFDPESIEPNGRRYHMVVGSLVSHYWTDVPQGVPFWRPQQLRHLSSFLTALHKHLLEDGGVAMFLDTFYGRTDRREEVRAWRAYLERELGSADETDRYLDRNASQHRAPDIELVIELARSLGYEAWSRQFHHRYPFRVLIIRKTS